MPENPYRLPRSVIPTRYELGLEPDLDAATFRGSEAVSIDVIEETETLAKQKSEEVTRLQTAVARLAELG